jgi:hypothetical protein
MSFKVAVEQFDKLPQSGTITVPAYCTLLQRSKASAFRDIKAGRIKTIKVGGSRRILISSARELLAEGAA